MFSLNGTAGAVGMWQGNGGSSSLLLVDVVLVCVGVGGTVAVL